ncbi:MAG: uroporphyrinogen-III synthase [Chloroflexi bacterium]|nr:uroporphyrinogen-III synthase [Chloroflexota bacterium]
MKRVVVTRPVDQAADLIALLARRGIWATGVPTVTIEPQADSLDDALARLDGAGWLVITSANGANAVLERLAAAGRRLPVETRVAAVGPATARALEAGGVRVDHVPDDYLTAAIAAGLGDVAGRRVVLARAEAATADLRQSLLARHAVVEEAIAYRTVEGPAGSREALRDALRRDVDGVTFTSGSTVRGFIALLGIADRPRAEALPAFCIGPVTADTARRVGLRVVAVAREHTAAGLAEAIADYFTEEA